MVMLSDSFPKAPLHVCLPVSCLPLVLLPYISIGIFSLVPKMLECLNSPVIVQPSSTLLVPFSANVLFRTISRCLLLVPQHDSLLVQSQPLP